MWRMSNSRSGVAVVLSGRRVSVNQIGVTGASFGGGCRGIKPRFVLCVAVAVGVVVVGGDSDDDGDERALKMIMIKLYNACHEEGADVSIGSRYKSGVNVVNWPMNRVLLSYFASKYVRFITRMNINDTTAGFVCYKRKVLETINLDKIRFVGYAFQIEMKFKAYLKKFKIEELNRKLRIIIRF